MIRRPSTWRVAWVPVLAVAVVTSIIGFTPPVAAAAVEVVADEAGLRAAWADPDVTLIELDGDIQLTQCTTVERVAPGAVEVVGHGHVIHQGCTPHVFSSTGSGLVRLVDVHLRAGDPGPTAGTAVHVHGPLEIEGASFEGLAAGPVISYDRILASDSTFVGNGGDAVVSYFDDLEGHDLEDFAIRCVRCQIASNDGHGLYLSGLYSSVSVEDSEIADNSGIGVYAVGWAALNRTAVIGNGGSGVSAVGVTVLNSTVVSNEVDGVESAGGAFIAQSTFADNGRHDVLASGPVRLISSVMVGSGENACNAAVISGESSFSGTSSFVDDVSCNLDAASYQGPDVDPRIGRLADNGGPTRTMLPLRGSPLIGAVPPATCADPEEGLPLFFDQRRSPRPAEPGGPCDIGAVETGGIPDETCPDPFSDVGAGHVFCWDIEWMRENGHSTGWPDGTYRPGLDVSRQALAAFLWRLSGSPETTTAPGFGDVPPNHPFADAIAWLDETGIAEGYPDGTFRPTTPVTRQAFAAMLWRLTTGPGQTGESSPTFTDVGVDHTFREAIEWLVDVGIAHGYEDGTFRPGDRTTRQAMAAFLRRHASPAYVPN